MLSLEKLKSIAHFIESKTRFRPKIAIVCGSGLGGLVDLVTDKCVIPYSDIDGFPKSTVVGHAGNLVFGNLKSKIVVLMQGRFHPYEGYCSQTCTVPIRVLHLIGIKYLLLTNAAGGLNPNYRVGDMMIIKDHISFPALCGFNPLVGHNEESFGQRFIPLSDAYDKSLRLKAKKIADRLGEGKRTHEGVYVMQVGPAYETVSECKMMQIIGGDVCGMSTTQEVIVARHMNMIVFGISLVTNECILVHDCEAKANHLEVLAVAQDRAIVMQQMISELVAEIEIKCDCC